MALTDAQISAKLNEMERDISGINKALGVMQDNINSRLHLSELQTTSLELQGLIRDNAEVITDLQERLAKVALPDDTRYYLEESDLEAFKHNFSKMKAMLSRFERLYGNVVAYVARLDA